MGGLAASEGRARERKDVLRDRVGCLKACECCVCICICGCWGGWAC